VFIINLGNSRIAKGVAYSAQDRFDDAIRCYDEALKVDARNIDAMVARGAALANLKRFDRAIKQLEYVLQLQPDHKNANCYLETIKQKLAAQQEQSVDKKTKPALSSSIYALLLSEEKKTKKSKKHKKHKKDKKKSRHSNSSDGRSRKRSRSPGNHGLNVPSKKK
jgi:tetratricopeptide (TPR) repeat protein